MGLGLLVGVLQVLWLGLTQLRRQRRRQRVRLQGQSVASAKRTYWAQMPPRVLAGQRSLLRQRAPAGRLP